ncbi:MAG: hypothetical protein ABW166_20930 [Sedimenticola sp.]
MLTAEVRTECHVVRSVRLNLDNGVFENTGPDWTEVVEGAAAETDLNALDMEVGGDLPAPAEEEQDEPPCFDGAATGERSALPIDGCAANLVADVGVE